MLSSPRDRKTVGWTEATLTPKQRAEVVLQLGAAALEDGLAVPARRRVVERADEGADAAVAL